MNRRRRCGGGNGVARRGGCRCGRPRNEQLLARRQDARSPVTVGLQDRGWRNAIVARQGIECIARADDDCGAAMSRSAVRRDRAWRGTASGLNRLPRRSIGSYPTPPSRGAVARGRIRLRCCVRRGRELAQRLRAGILRKFAAFDRGGTEAVASGCEAKGLEKESWESRVDMSALQPANPVDISASTAIRGTRSAQSNSTTWNMVNYPDATYYCFE